MPARLPVPPPFSGELIIPDGDGNERLEPLQVTLKEAARLLAYDLRTWPYRRICELAVRVEPLPTAAEHQQTRTTGSLAAVVVLV